MEAQKAPLHKRLNVLRLLITNTNNIPKRMHYLDLLAQYIHEMEQKKIDHLENNNSIDYLKFTYHRAYANISSAQHNAPKMFYHIQKCMKSEAEVDNAFAYAKRVGVKKIIGVPNYEILPYVDKKVKEYDFNYAIHLHGPDIKIYSDATDAWEHTKDLDPRIGMNL